MSPQNTPRHVYSIKIVRTSMTFDPKLSASLSGHDLALTGYYRTFRNLTTSQRGGMPADFASALNLVQMLVMQAPMLYVLSKIYKWDSKVMNMLCYQTFEDIQCQGCVFFCWGQASRGRTGDLARIFPVACVLSRSRRDSHRSSVGV